MKSTIISLFVILLAISGFAQNASSSTVHMASPTASSLGKFIDIPVSYHTGTPEINISIHTVKEGPLQLPIELSYHASGLKVMEQSSWVGAGWALRAADVITRSTRGNPDEIPNSDGYYLQNQGYYSYLFMPITPGEPATLAYYEFGNGRRDGEPDIFFFSCGAYSGKFYFRADKSVVVVPQQDVSVEPLFCTGAGCATNEVLYGWILTTPDGTKYYYGATTDNTSDVDAVERSTPYSTASGITFAKEISSWYLRKIQSADQLNTITLHYAKEDYGFYTVSMFPVADAGSAPSGGSGINLVKTIVNGVRLSSVETTDGTVTFIPDANLREDLSSDWGGLNDLGNTAVNLDHTNARALKQIRIQGTNLDKAFEFNYGYFEDNVNSLHGTFGVAPGMESTYSIHSDRKRLKLLSFQEKSTDNTVVKPPYVFSYFDETSVPRTLLLAQDHWGYYNGANDNNELIPSLSTDGGATYNEGLGANREAAWPAMRAGALQKIQYPTGGTCEFDFESHENGYFREWFTYPKAGQISNKSAGFMGGDYSSPTDVRTLTAGKYIVEMDGTHLLSGSGGQLHVGSYTYSIGSGQTSSILIDLPSGTYNIYVSVSSPIATGHGVMGSLFGTTPVRNVESPLIGGLRIKTMKTNDGSPGANDIIQSFDYKDSNGNGTSQGVLYSRPVYISLARNERMRESGVASGNDINGNFTGYASTGCLPMALAEAYFISPSSLHPMRTSQGSHIGYNQVKVTQADGGYTIYKYKLGQSESGDVSVKVINKSFCDPFAPNFPPAPLPHDFSRGELRKVAVYNSSGTRLKETNYLTEYTTEAVGINGLLIANYMQIFLATEYELKTARKTKSTTLEWVFNASSPGSLPAGTITETFYGSPNHSLPTRKVISEATAPAVNSTEISQVIRGKVLDETRNTYVGDIVIPSPAACNAAYTVDQTLLSTLTQLLNSYNTTKSACTDFNCRFVTYLHYVEAVNNARKTYVTNRSAYYNAYKTCMTASSTYNVAGTDLKALIDLKNRNEVSGILESSKWRDGKFLSSAFTTYTQFDNRLYTYPAKKELIDTSIPLSSSDFIPVTNTASALTKDTKYRVEETLTYKNGNVVEVAARGGVVTSYLWSHNLPVARAVGVPFSVLNAAFQSAGSNLPGLRNQPSLLNAQLSTYTYDPLVGMKSQTDPNNATTFFVYDKLGRLQFLKDNDGNVVRKIEYGYQN